MNDITLDFTDKGLTEPPIEHPEWNSATELLLRGNSFKELDASLIPKTVTVLILSDCSIETIIGKFPEHLKVLFLDNNKLTELNSEILNSEIVNLTADANKISVIKGNLPDSIEVLNLSSNLLNSFTAIPANLQSINIQNNPIAEKLAIYRDLNGPKFRQLIERDEQIILAWKTDDKLITEEEAQKYDIAIIPFEDFIEVKKVTAEHIKSSNLCKSKIGDGYIMKTLFKKNLHVIEASYKGEIVGIAIFFMKGNNLGRNKNNNNTTKKQNKSASNKNAKKNANNTRNSERKIIIDILCSIKKNVGTMILNKIKEYMNDTSDIKLIQVESIYDAIEFYKAKNFKIRCSSNTLCPMSIKRED